MNKKTVLILVGVVLIICCIVGLVLTIVFKDTILGYIFPTATPVVTTLTPSPTVATNNVTGTWAGIYNVNYPNSCSGEGNWTANLLEQNGVLSGSYTSDIGLGGAVSGSISGSEINWNVGGSGGVTFSGNILNTSVSGSFTGPACGGSSYTSGIFSGNKQ